MGEEQPPHTVVERKNTDYEKLVDNLRGYSLKLLEKKQSPDWLVKSLKEARNLDAVVARMRHIHGGQVAVLERLEELSPGSKWNRGGTFVKYRELIGSPCAQFFTEEELDTPVIDGGNNGVINRPSLARGYLQISKRARPVIYTVTVPALIQGLKKDQIVLVDEHDYDLCIKNHDDIKSYLGWCKKYLQIEFVNSNN